MLGNDPAAAQSLLARPDACDDADGVTIASQLNGSLTALLLYMGEIKRHSDQLSQAPGNRAYLQQVVDNACQQTERVCALLGQLATPNAPLSAALGRKIEIEQQAGGATVRIVPLASAAGHKPLTKREREVLKLISEGCSNKQGALRMRISPRTFESHRAEAMRKLGARNTADLVRAALLFPAV